MRRPVKLLIAALVVSGSAAAAVRTLAPTADVGFIPYPPKGKGEHCVAPTEFMRRNHMKMLLHHRWRTVHLGIRTQQYDLERCVSCHAVRGSDGHFVSYSSPKHFCRTCHDYAAVKIDCFECHASHPSEPSKTAATGTGSALHDHKDHERTLAALNKYLEETRR